MGRWTFEIEDPAKVPAEFWLEEIRLCRELGLKLMAFSALGHPAEWQTRIRQAARGLIVDEFGRDGKADCFLGGFRTPDNAQVFPS